MKKVESNHYSIRLPIVSLILDSFTNSVMGRLPFMAETTTRRSITNFLLKNYD